MTSHVAFIGDYEVEEVREWVGHAIACSVQDCVVIVSTGYNHFGVFEQFKSPRMVLPGGTVLIDTFREKRLNLLESPLL